MASYEVFEDRENDSASAYDNLKENSKPSQLLQKRAVLGVLQQNTAKFTFRSSNTQITQEVRVEKVIQDENALSRRLAAARSKAAPTIPVAQFKAFSVYEDDNENTDSCVYKPPNDLCPDVVKAPENVSTTRTPLAEITESVLESPACSTDTKNSSHMSVDRTLIKTPYKAYPEFRENCSDAERFYELIEYRQDIYEYLRRTETRHRPKPGYMRKQPDITSSMRTVLVDWLVEVCGEYRMHQESLMLAVNYVDRFLSHMSVVRTKLQLVGTAAMFIASKYEEIYPPDVGEFVYITDDTYNKKQVLRMEHLILKVLKFDLSIPTVGAFLGCYCITWNLTVETRSLAMYLAELSMLEDEPYMKYLPSHLAAGCLALARYTLGHDPWLAHMHRASGYSFADLTECIGHLVRTHHNAARLPQQAIQEKYRTSKYQHVATIEPRALNLN